MGSHPVRETKLCIYRPCLLDMGTAKDPHLSQRSAVDQWELAKYSHYFRQKNRWVGGGVLCTPLITNIN
jgi:hypothetical protein